MYCIALYYILYYCIVLHYIDVICLHRLGSRRSRISASGPSLRPNAAVTAVAAVAGPGPATGRATTGAGKGNEGDGEWSMFMGELMWGKTMP